VAVGGRGGKRSRERRAGISHAARLSVYARAMNRRRRRRPRIRILRGDVLVVVLLLGAAVVAYVVWPEMAVADIAMPMGALIVFVTWRLSRTG
jgi:hypothetical protein